MDCWFASYNSINIDPEFFHIIYYTTYWYGMVLLTCWQKSTTSNRSLCINQLNLMPFWGGTSAKVGVEIHDPTKIRTRWLTVIETWTLWKDCSIVPYEVQETTRNYMVQKANNSRKVQWSNERVWFKFLCAIPLNTVKTKFFTSLTVESQHYFQLTNHFTFWFKEQLYVQYRAIQMVSHKSKHLHLYNLDG